MSTNTTAAILPVTRAQAAEFMLQGRNGSLHAALQIPDVEFVRHDLHNLS